MDFINCKLGFHSAVNSGEIEYFDAFVSYHPQDLPFVDELTQKLEDEEGFKLCITDRDMCVGITQHAATAELIEKRYVRSMDVEGLLVTILDLETFGLFEN